MRVAVLERDGARILECAEPIARVEDALGLVSSCAEHRAWRLLIAAPRLPTAFFDLRTRFAGEFLQKLQNYGIRLAGVFPPERDYGERFAEFLSEARRGRGFRAFDDRDAAEAWLAAGPA